MTRYCEHSTEKSGSTKYSILGCRVIIQGTDACCKYNTALSMNNHMLRIFYVRELIFEMCTNILISI